jgi:hypothetical protein
MVKDIAKGPVSTEVTLTIAPGIDVVAVISTRSADALGLAAGKVGYECDGDSLPDNEGPLARVSLKDTRSGPRY